MTRWLKSALDLAVDVTAFLLIEVGALVDDWRADR